MKKKWIIRVVIIVVVLAVAAEAIWFLAPDLFKAADQEGFVRASGRIEGRNIEISSKIPGRVVELLADEGDELEAGEVVVRISSEELEAACRSAEANLALWINRKGQAELDLRLTTRQVETGIDLARAQLESAQANLERAEAAAEQAQKDHDRYKELADDGVVPKVTYDQARLANITASKELEAAGKQVRQAEVTLQQAEDARLTIDLKRAAVADADKTIAAAQAELDAARSRLADAEIRAPAGGIVLERVVQPGEVINTGTPILTMVDPDDLYLKVYVPNIQTGKLKIGNGARIFTDAYPEEYFPAEVTRISERSQFTPKNVETKEQRVNLVFEVKLGRIDNASRRLKPGMPAEAVVRWDDSKSW
jgi:HlyD family secretion protein